MTQSAVSAEAKRFAISLTGLKPGTVPEDLVVALQSIFPRKTVEQIRGALARLPLLLTRSATEEQAQKVKGFLESKGAILRLVTSTPPATPTPPASTARSPSTAPIAPSRSGVVEAAAVPKRNQPYTGIERRAKPRLHPGISIHPMGIGEILDRSFRLLRQHFFLFFFILLIPQGTFFLFNKGSQIFLGGGVLQDMTAGMGIGLIVSVVLAVLVMMILQFWAQGALIHAVSETYLGHATSLATSYGAMRSRLGRLLGTMFLMGILIVLVPALMGIAMAIVAPMLKAMSLSGGKQIILTMILLLVGAVWFLNLLLNWLLVDKVVVLEGKSWGSALRRSKELMNTRTEQGFWKRPKNKAGLILLLGFLIGVGIHLLFQVPGFLSQMFLPMSLGGVTLTLQQVLNVIANSLATVFTAIAMILFYYDIRLRSEGFDLKAMAEHL
ncbi:MAG: hypothetical protein LJE89_03400 [Deltaproteobacteria bacterium]|nr:hypothetical protein [Deltaproteobacteria bacterium]